MAEQTTDEKIAELEARIERLEEFLGDKMQIAQAAREGNQLNAALGGV